MGARDADGRGVVAAYPCYTDHAMLIVWGQFARRFGLISTLMRVPRAQKTVERVPQTKLLQLLVATLAGCAHLQEMAKGPPPLVKDRSVAEAWEQPSWADPSAVSRTFRAADEQTVAATLAVLHQFSQPFIDREVVLAVRAEGALRYDGDLTGREVSPTSATYPEAAFGWMGDHVGLGYPAAVVSRTSPPYGRILLAAKRHPGDTVSGDCLHELVAEAEAATGVRPRRRAELVAERLRARGRDLGCQEQEVQRAEQLRERVAAGFEKAKAAAAERTAQLERLAATARPRRASDRTARRPKLRSAKRQPPDGSSGGAGRLPVPRRP